MRRLLLLIVPLVLVAGCLETRTWQAAELPPNASGLEGVEQVRVTQAAGSELVLNEPGLVETAEGAWLTGISEADGAGVRIPVTDITRLETRQLSTGRILGNLGLGALVGIVLVSLLILAAVSNGGFIGG